MKIVFLTALIGVAALTFRLAEAQDTSILELPAGTQSSIPMEVVEPTISLDVADPSLSWAACSGGDEALETALAGCEFTLIRQDPETGAMVLFVRSPGSAMFAAHWHTHFESIVGVSGTMRVFYEDGQKLDIAPARYVFNPVGLAHSAQCISQAPCSFVVHTNSPFDLNLPGS